MRLTLRAIPRRWRRPVATRWIPSAPAAASVTAVKVWTGSEWVERPVYVYDGSSWVRRPVTVYTGSSWT